MKRINRDENGQVVTYFVGSLLIMFGLMAFAFDVGLLFHARRVVQNAADPGALAGATELSGCGDQDPTPESIATTYAQKNLAGQTFQNGSDPLESVAVRS